MMLCILVLIATASAGPGGHFFKGEKVFRVHPKNEEQVKTLTTLSTSVQLDFWTPDSPSQISPNMVVDFHAAAEDISYIQDFLKKSGMEYEVLIEDLQMAIQRQLDNQYSGYKHSYEKYNTWDQVAAWTAQMASDYPSLVTREEIGNSYEGRPMYVLKLGKSHNSKKTAFIECGIHAREWISPAFCQWFVNEAVHTYETDKTMNKLLRKMTIYVLPVLNVDGYVFTWTNHRLWRKNRAGNPNSICTGTDLNRNFNSSWCSIGASKEPCDDTYCGSSPESECETKNVASFIRKHKSTMKAYISVHSYSQLLMFPYGFTFDHVANYKTLDAIAGEAVRQLTRLYNTAYRYGAIAETIYPAAGASLDWAYIEGVKYSFVFELRDRGRYGFLLPESEIKPTCEETMVAVKYIFHYVLTH